jgi:hypothetical protein
MHDNQIKLSQAKINRRYKLAYAWLDDLDHLCDHLDGGLGRVVNAAANYAADLAGVGVPIPAEGNNWGLRRWDGPFAGGFYLVPLLPIDAKLHPFFRDAIIRASYHEGPRAIFLPPDPMSPMWRGITMYHELCHTLAHRKKWYRRRRLAHWVEEYEVYKEEIGIVRRVYGRKYGDAAYRLSKKLESGLRNHNLQTRDRLLVPDSHIKRIFGTPASRLESGSQRALIILDAIYRAIDRIYPKGRRRDREHYAVTQWFCDPKGYKQSQQRGKQATPHTTSHNNIHFTT